MGCLETGTAGSVKLLLDTHIWVWSATNPKRLARRIQARLDQPTNEIWVSPLSSWEVILLNRKGRLQLPTGPSYWFDTVWSEGIYREAPLTQDVISNVFSVWLPHQDPIDNLLAATARAYGLTLVTADEAMLAGKGFNVLANR